MRRFLHNAWPFAAVMMLTAVLALQIPRKALLFEPTAIPAPGVFASFVSYDSAAYESVLRHARMSWQLRGKTGRTRESHVDAFDFLEEVPLLQSLALPDEFVQSHATDSFEIALTPLLPPSVADKTDLVPVSASRDDENGKRRVCAELLELPESLTLQE